MYLALCWSRRGCFRGSAETLKSISRYFLTQIKRAGCHARKQKKIRHLSNSYRIACLHGLILLELRNIFLIRVVEGRVKLDFGQSDPLVLVVTLPVLMENTVIMHRMRQVCYGSWKKRWLSAEILQADAWGLLTTTRLLLEACILGLSMFLICNLPKWYLVKQTCSNAVFNHLRTWWLIANSSKRGLRLL